MRRFWSTLPLLALLLLGCRIEPTPAEYIDVLEIPEDEFAGSREELTDRLRSTASALERRNISDLLTALLPAAQLGGFGPEDEPISDATTLAYALTAPTGGRAVSMRDVRVEVGPQNDVAWFRADYVVESEGEGPGELRFSGVFLRQEGEWRLVQAHVSRGVSSSPPPAPAAAGTPAGGG